MKRMIQEFYQAIGGDYGKAIARMSNDERIQKYLRFFLEDDSFHQLEEAMTAEDCEAAFRGAHTLKGVCQNMSFAVLGTVAEEITEALRAKDFETAKTIYPKVKEAYEQVTEAIRQMLA